MLKMDDKLIVIVDDDPDMVKIVSLNLKEEGYRVKGLLDAKSLFKFLSKENPDLIILDLMLPDMSGLEVCKKLKKDERFSSVPVIMVTGKGEEADKVSGLDMGSDDYIVKPLAENC